MPVPDFALDVSALRQPRSSYARVTRLIEEAARTAGLEVERWEEGIPQSPVLWVPRLRLPRVPIPWLIVTCHDVNPLLPDGRPTWKRWWRRQRYLRAMRSAQQRAWRMTAPSQDAARRIGNYLSAPPPVVMPWYAPGEFRPDPGPEDEQRLANWGLRPGYVLYLGALRRHKNWDLLLRAYAGLPARLRGRHPLVLAGSVGQARERADQQLTELGIEACWVTDLEDEELPSLYRGAAAFVFPSRLEGFGLPPLEAQACGVPVLAARATALPEVLGAGAKLFDPDDRVGFQEALEELLENPEAREQASRAALANAARFSARRTGQALRGLLESVPAETHLVPSSS